MVYVTMKTGEIRQYNKANTWDYYFGKVRIASGVPIIENIVACLPEQDVKFIEFCQPCKVYSAPSYSQSKLESALRVVLTESKTVKGFGAEARLLSDLKSLLNDFDRRKRRWK